MPTSSFPLSWYASCGRRLLHYGSLDLMHLIAIGDIGVVDGMMHIGDEAMFEQFLNQARARGISEVVAVSSNPAETMARYGVTSVGRLGLTGSVVQMIARGELILAGELEPDNPALATIEAIASASRVIVTGAGNLSSRWPVHIERWVISQLAKRAGIPFVITGQTLGPDLSASDAVLLSELLESAELVGVRERASYRLAETLGVQSERLQQNVDDASFLGPESASIPASPAQPPYCLVSLSTYVGATDRDAFLSAVGTLLDWVASLGLEVRFLAHFGPLSGDPHRGDVVMHEAVASLMKSSYLVEPSGTAVEAATLARRASMVISSRYHPAVFAAAAGVPTLGIAVDDYTTVKLRGALCAFGQDGVITGDDLVAGLAPDAAAAVWAARETIRSAVAAELPARLRESALWWDRVLGWGS
jgi:polysaccharide pyruvyl transferase WcaK-like protein